MNRAVLERDRHPTRGVEVGSISFVVVPVKIVLAVFFPLFERTGLTDDIADGAGRRGDTHPARATVLPARIEPTDRPRIGRRGAPRSEEHTSELKSLMRISYAVLCCKNKTDTTTTT